jgi:ABC-type branched-subunit amino acid transport system ATPase component
MPEEPLLVLERVERRFGGVTAVAGVSFDVRRGSVTGVIGPNGAGKTTLFNLITGALVPTGGRIRFLGRDVTGWPPERLARLGMARTFQNIRLFRSLTVREHLELSLHLGARRPGWWQVAGPDAGGEELIGRILDTLHLTAWADAGATTLSYAAQRRVEIGRALALRPQLLLLDEPAAGMNPAETRELAEMLSGLAAEGLTLLLVDHDMGLVMNLCRHIVVLNFGEVIARGRPRDIQREPAVLEAYLGRGWADRAQD